MKEEPVRRVKTPDPNKFRKQAFDNNNAKRREAAPSAIDSIDGVVRAQDKN